ncbi:hydrolase 76 protein [Ceratobasidium sp. 394]|nr:hydrolase 76 protein [Ceratobasidium sp. 394]
MASTWARQYMALEMSHFYQPYNTSGGCGCYYTTTQLWYEVTSLQGVVNYMMVTGDNSYKSNVLNHRYAFTSGSVSKLLTPATFVNSHDDGLWTTLLYFKISEWLEKLGTPDTRYWNAGVAILDWAGIGRTESRNGSTSACDGGVWWEAGASKNIPYKNAVTNEQFIAASAVVYLKTKNVTYLNNAITTWNFLRDHMRRPASNTNQPGLYSDGTRLPDCTNNGDQTWTYNQGVVLHALGLLYKATGNHTYVDEALVTLDAIIAYKLKNGVLAESCDLPDTTACDADQVGFKGLFMRHLQYFLELVNDPTINAKYSDWIGLQARAMNQYARRADGMISQLWWGTDNSRAIYPPSVNAFSSGVDAILTSIKFGTC